MLYRLVGLTFCLVFIYMSHCASGNQYQSAGANLILTLAKSMLSLDLAANEFYNPEFHMKCLTKD